MDTQKLETILDKHQKWLNKKEGGERADLRGADLQGAYLQGAYLRGADLTAPTMLLMANWGTVSDELTLELMRYDAANHPDPSNFDDWKNGGRCPYNGTHWQRCASFKEKRELWSPGPAKSALELVLMLFAEKDIKR